MAQSVEHVIGNDEVISSILISSSNSRRHHAAMAQSVEHVIGNDEVISSILISSSKILRSILIGGFFFIEQISGRIHWISREKRRSLKK